MTKAIILAGGKGERLYPLTKEIPKTIIPFQGRTLLDNVIDLYWKYNVFETWLVVGYLGNKIMEKYPLPPIFEKIPAGTGGFLKIIKDTPGTNELFKDDFYVNNGDNLLNIDLQAMMEAHKKSGNVATIACVKSDDVRDYGAVVIKAGKISNFKEKQRSPKPKKGYINSGYYIFSPEIFNYLPDIDWTTPETRSTNPISLERDVFPKLAKAGKLGAFTETGQWFDVGTFERYQKAYEEWKGV